MSEPEEKERHARKRKKNIMAKILRDTGEHKGAFSLKIINPKKTRYKREKVNLKNIEVEMDDE